MNLHFMAKVILVATRSEVGVLDLLLKTDEISPQNSENEQICLLSFLGSVKMTKNGFLSLKKICMSFLRRLFILSERSNRVIFRKCVSIFKCLCSSGVCKC